MIDLSEEGKKVPHPIHGKTLLIKPVIYVYNVDAPCYGFCVQVSEDAWVDSIKDSDSEMFHKELKFFMVRIFLQRKGIKSLNVNIIKDEGDSFDSFQVLYTIEGLEGEKESTFKYQHTNCWQNKYQKE
jgi:hypothetical protein